MWLLTFVALGAGCAAPSPGVDLVLTGGQVWTGVEGEGLAQGVLVADKGRGLNRMITVRRIVANEGVERIFPLHSPRIAKLEVVRRGDARRAKLYFLRDRVGKATRVKERIVRKTD